MDVLKTHVRFVFMNHTHVLINQAHEIENTHAS